MNVDRRVSLLLKRRESQRDYRGGGIFINQLRAAFTQVYSASSSSHLCLTRSNLTEMQNGSKLLSLNGRDVVLVKAVAGSASLIS